MFHLNFSSDALKSVIILLLLYLLLVSLLLLFNSSSMLMLPLQSVNNNTLVTDPGKAKLYSLSFLFIYF